jgi:cytidylate kinase
MAGDPLLDLTRHVAMSTGLPAGTAARVVADVLAYLDESVEEYVRRRHRELQQRELTNAQIWTVVTAELLQRRFPAPALTERQLRRIVYG